MVVFTVVNHNKINTPNSRTSYELLAETTKGVIKGVGRHPRMGHEMYRMEERVKPLQEVEASLINDTDRLIASLDGTVEEFDNFLDGHRRYEGPVDGAIYLDKSARPVRALVSELWDDMSDAKKPKASFLNVDKENWLYAMGYSREDFTERYIDPNELSLDKMNPEYLVMQLARIRSLYLNDSDMAKAEALIGKVEDGEEDVDSLRQLWDAPTVIDGKHIALVDEVKSTSATLKITDLLMREAIPDARFEPMFFATPQTMTYDFYDAGKDEMYKKITDTEKPVWYDSNMSDGRGGIENKNESWSQKSPYRRQRLGKYVLSTSFNLINGRLDERGSQLRHDFKVLADKFRSGKIIDYIPADRGDYTDRIERYYGMPLNEWVRRRRNGESMQGVER